MKIVKLISLFAIVIALASCKSESYDDIYTGDPGEVIDLTGKRFNSLVADQRKGLEEWEYLGDKPAIVVFHATWCSYCNKIAPILAELSTEYKEEIYVYKVDTDLEASIANAYRITTVPTIYFVPMVGAPTIVEGAISKKEFINRINSVMLNK